MIKIYRGQVGVLAQPYGQGYPTSQPTMGVPGMGYQQPYPAQVPLQQPQPAQPQFPDPMNLQRTKPQFYGPETMQTYSRSSYIKNIGVTLMIYLLMGLFCGLGLLMSALVVDQQSIGYALFIGLTTISFTPLIAFIIGMDQGRTIQSEFEAIFTGIISNLIGFLIILFLIAGFLGGAIAIKEYSDTGVLDFIKMLMGIIIPCAVLGGLAAFLTERQIIS